ncbi:PASTA domain-containing protein [Methanolobus mangrovi]|uniref:PASTA domain-containing protein n=1 Tax=Methanolobus mangrovi TaxID=3072977 RepID=A0AA51UE08_9EURY|nr:PASTA domain-containing protein [Methanolobus mangrovi]WMW21234.1 PASTA domain-containing protein [Methanolobus mangrovi]
MVDIIELRNNIDRLNRSTTAAAKKQSYTLVQKTIEGLESEYGAIQKELVLKDDSLELLKKENLNLKQDYAILDSRVQEILKEKAEIEKQLEQLSRTRPELTSSNLIKTFRDSLEEMDVTMNSTSSNVNYSVSSMSIKLRTNLAVQDNELRFQLPKADDVIPAGNLSEVEFTISSSAKQPVFSDLIDVPDVIGLDVDSALSLIKDAGFVQGEITEKESDLIQGTVLSQIPSGSSVARSGDTVDIVISKITSVLVPDVVGMTLDSAKKELVGNRLTMGKVTEQPDALKVGTILDQSVAANEYADVNAPIDVVVGTEKVEFAAVSGKPELVRSPANIDVLKPGAKVSPAKQPSRLSSVRKSITR